MCLYVQANLVKLRQRRETPTAEDLMYTNLLTFGMKVAAAHCPSVMSSSLTMTMYRGTLRETIVDSADELSLLRETRGACYVLQLSQGRSAQQSRHVGMQVVTESGHCQMPHPTQIRLRWLHHFPLLACTQSQMS